MNRNILIAVLLMAFIPLASAHELVISAPQVVDSNFVITLSFDETVLSFNGAEFEVDGANINSVSYPASSSAIAEFYQDKALIILSSSASVKTFAELSLHVSGTAGETITITIKNLKISYDVNGEPTLLDIADKSVDVTLSSCVSYPNSHTTPTGAELFNTGCYCDIGYEPHINTVGQAECVVPADNIYGTLSVPCEEGLDPIGDTGYCCAEGYEFAFNDIDDMLGNGEDACIAAGNRAPVARIKNPSDNSEHKAGTKIYFKANGTDSDGQIVSYLWDFGDRSKPWGYLEADGDEVVCKRSSSTTKCSEDEAYALAEYEQELDGDIPCSCDLDEYGIELLNVYQDSASTSQNSFHTYSSKYDCTEWDDDEDTTECEVTLWVFDDANASGRTSIDVELETPSGGGGIEGESGLYCGDGIVTGTEVCDVGEVEACASGICKSDCTCQPASDGSDITLDDTSDTICGNAKCEFGENAATCLADCHCGDGICQESVESKKTCPSDCKSNTMIIVLVIILAGAGILFFLWKRGFDFSGFPPFEAITEKFTGSKGGGERSEPRGIAPSNPEAKLAEYIQRTRQQGHSYTQIKEALEAKGWKEDKINKVFSRVGLP